MLLWLVNLDFAGSEVLSASSPFRVAAFAVYSAGTTSGATYSAGQESSETYSAGATAGTVVE